MSEFTEKLRERAEAILEPYRYAHGDDHAVVKVALRVLAAADEVDAELSGRRVTTAEASDRTGWAHETLQKYARAKLAGEPVPAAWEGLRVEAAAGGYLFILGSIPANPRSVAA